MAGHSPAHKMNPDHINSFRRDLLDWYDHNRRALPWRAPPGQKADPYHVWLSEIMLQQTVVAAVIPYFLKFIQRWPTVQDMAAARNEDVMEAWAGLGYYARARNLLKCARVITEERGGIFPVDQDELKRLPGIGDYTSAAIAAIAFDRPAAVMDGNVERVMARYFAISEPLPDAKKTLRVHVQGLSMDRTDRPGDFAQAMMDLGATICIPKTPRCGLCPLRNDCTAFAVGIQDSLPRRRAKSVKPQRFGYVYWASNSTGELLFEQRSEKGLLGGMPGLPTSDWSIRNSNPGHLEFIKPFVNKSAPRELTIFHSFTHFDLELSGYVVNLADISVPAGYFWVPEGKISHMGLPTVFKKFVRIMLHDKH
jgi:A/G-specific adenine glycosylase